ncbi:hypothetical protein ACS3SW_00725 [Roseobacteraceae bacterium S113]
MGDILYATNLENWTPYYLALGGRLSDGFENEWALVNWSGIEVLVLRA